MHRRDNGLQHSTWQVSNIAITVPKCNLDNKSRGSFHPLVSGFSTLVRRHVFRLQEAHVYYELDHEIGICGVVNHRNGNRMV